jgi:hypothetical protein
MAETAHQLWPNQETTRAVVAASLDAKLRWPKTGGNESFDDGSRPGVVQEEFDKQPVDEVAQEWVAHATKVDRALTYEPPSTDDRKQPMTISRLAQVLAPMSLPDANSSWPLSGDRAVIQQQRRFGLDDVVGLAVLETKDAAGDIPEPVGEAGARSPTSAMLRFGAAVGSAAVIAACVMVFPSMWKAAHEPVPAPISAPLTSVNRDNGESERMTRAQPGAAPVVEPTSSLAQLPSAQAESAPAGRPAAPARGPRAVSAPVADPSSSSAQVPSAQAEPAPVSEPQSPPAQTGRTQAEAAPSDEPSSSSARIPKPAPPAQTESTQAGAAPVTEPSLSPTQIPSAQGEVVPPARTESTQAEAAATSALSSSPTFPSAQVGAPVSQPQSSPAQTESTQAEAAPTTLPSSPPPQSASAPVGTGPAPPPPSAQAPSARAEAAPAPALPQAIPGASPSSQPPRMANAKAEPGPVFGFPSPPAQRGKAVTGLNSDAIAMLVSRANDF